MADFTSLITPEQKIGWNQTKRKNALTYGLQTANTNFSRANAQANQGLATNSLTQQYKAMRDKLPEQYAGRGLLNSGIYKQGLQDYGNSRLNAFGALTQKYGQQIGQLNLNQYGQGLQYNQAQADVNEQEKVARAQLAAALRGIA